MTQYLAELYSPTSAWLALDQDGRRHFFDSIGPGMAALSALGVEAVALGETDPETLYAPSKRFFAIWRAPDAAAMNALISGIAATGWHNYFQTVNAVGTGLDLNSHLAQLAAV